MKNQHQNKGRQLQPDHMKRFFQYFFWFFQQCFQWFKYFGDFK